MDFAYVTFVNGKNIELMKNTIDSILCFSKYKIIVYCIDFMIMFLLNTKMLL
jgi:hypothetical protein